MRQGYISHQVEISGKARKQIEKLPPEMANRLFTLVLSYFKANGPEAVRWPHSSRLKAGAAWSFIIAILTKASRAMWPCGW